MINICQTVETLIETEQDITDKGGLFWSGDYNMEINGNDSSVFDGNVLLWTGGISKVHFLPSTL